MKISSSTTTTTTTNSSVDAKLHNSNNGCLSGILRRLLCSGSLRTHPFDCIKESNSIGSNHQKNETFERKKEEALAATPGVVARLMGLDTMPELNSVRNLDSFGRSRSENSVGCWADFDPTQRHHRRVKSSLSLGEVPTFLLQENDEFLVLSFGGVGEECSLVRTNLGSGEVKEGSKSREDQYSKKRNCNKDRKIERKIGERDKAKDSHSIPARKKDGFRQPHGAQRPKSRSRSPNDKAEKLSLSLKKNKVEAECNSDNLSPVSVFDLDEFVSESETPVSEEGSKSRSSISRRKLCPELANAEYPPSDYCIAFSVLPESKSVKSERTKMKKDSRTLDHLEVCKLTGEDMSTLQWMPREMAKMDDFEEIKMEFGLQILDQLLLEIVTELGGLSV